MRFWSRGLPTVGDMADECFRHPRLAAVVAVEPRAALEAGTEGYQLADEIGDRFVSRMCRFWGVGSGQMMQGPLAAAAAQFRELVAEAEAAHDPLGQLAALSHLSHTLAFLGDTNGARTAATAAAELGAEFGGFMEGVGYGPLARAAAPCSVSTRQIDSTRNFRARIWSMNEQINGGEGRVPSRRESKQPSESRWPPRDLGSHAPTL